MRFEHFSLFGGMAYGLFLFIVTLFPRLTLADETVGDRFRKVLADVDARCKREKRGPYLDRGDPEYRKKVADTSCDVLKLQPRDWRDAKLVKLDSQPYPVPQDWLATPEGRFAHSIKLPPLNGKQRASFRPGMSGKEYFEELCRNDSGEFIGRTVTGVDGVRQDRPWIAAPNGYRDLLFWTREKGGIQNSQDYLVQPPAGRYQFLDLRLSEADARKSGAPFLAFYRDQQKAKKKDVVINAGDGKFVRTPYIVAEELRRQSVARYAFTWRGLWAVEGVQHGIEGFELITYQIEPFEVVAYQRDFWRHLQDDSQRDPRTTYTISCSQTLPMMPPHQFLQGVLVPKSHP